MNKIDQETKDNLVVFIVGVVIGAVSLYLIGIK